MTKTQRSLRQRRAGAGAVRHADGGQLRRINFLIAMGLSICMAGNAQAQSQVDLTQMQLEDLMNIKVTSVSKKEQTLSRTAAAVFVINQEDIRRSGATNIPDLLRMAPGVDVQQVDANAWAISIRGFNARYSNKVLVLIDGRTVYTPAFSGVFWEHLDMPLENIERIEIMRGPGATVWGANAVTGVISILTKSSKDTQGGLVTAIGGSHSGGGVTQYGAAVGQKGSYRAFGKYSRISNSAMANGDTANDHWMRVNGGFRTDWDISKRDSLTVQGDLFANEANQTLRSGFIATPWDRIFNQDIDATGGNLMARWNHTLAGGSTTSLQTYFDTYRRTDMGVPEMLKTFDVDFQDHVNTAGRNDIVWGLGYRVYNSKLAPGYGIAFSPPSQTDSLFSAFVQDELRVTDSLWFTAGIRLEHNHYTGFQVEPSLRLAWTPAASRRHTVWASASKAVRQPSRADTAIDAVLQSIPIGPGVEQVLRVYGNPKIKDEEARDYELGYRAEIAKTLSLDAAAFLTFFRNLNTVEPQPMKIIPGPPVQFLIPMLYDNKAHAVDYGGELSLNWNATSRWRLSPGYSYLHATIRQDPTSQGLPSVGLANFPQNMFQVRSQLNLARNVQFDQSLSYTARLPGGSIPGLARLDLRLARRIGESAEISLVGQNLLRPHTMEFGDSNSVIGTQAVRSIYGKITWRF